LALPQPHGQKRAPVHAPIHPARQRLGRAHRTGAGRLWHAQPQENEGGDAVPEDRQSTGLPTAAWSYQAREHRALSRRRARRRAGTFRSAGNLVSANASSRNGWEAAISRAGKGQVGRLCCGTTGVNVVPAKGGSGRGSKHRQGFASDGPAFASRRGRRAPAA